MDGIDKKDTFLLRYRDFIIKPTKIIGCGGNVIHEANLEGKNGIHLTFFSDNLNMLREKMYDFYKRKKV